MKQHPQAIAILEAVASKQRTPKINMALAKLYHMNGMERAAITSYKEVLKQCPLAFDAAQGLLSLDAKGTEVASLMINGTVGMPNMDWITVWIKAHAQFYSREFTQSILSFKQLECKTQLRNNVDILTSLGEASYYHGDFVTATQVLERAHKVDPYSLRGMDIYAALLYKEKKNCELETVCSWMMSTSDSFPEAWVAAAYHCHNVKKSVKPLYFVQKALLLNPRHIEALILKGIILLDLKKVQDAISSFREAYRIVPYRYEALKGLVDCYLSIHRIQEACSISCGAIKLIGKTPRTLTLYASVLVKDPISCKKAKGLLEEALKLDPNYLTAVYLLAEIYDQEKDYTKGIELLKRQTENQSTCKLHQMLGDFLARNNEHEKALQHFSIALNFEPNNIRAIEGTQRVERNPDYAEPPFDEEEFEDLENDMDNIDAENNLFPVSWNYGEPATYVEPINVDLQGLRPVSLRYLARRQPRFELLHVVFDLFLLRFETRRLTVADTYIRGLRCWADTALHHVMRLKWGCKAHFIERLQYIVLVGYGHHGPFQGWVCGPVPEGCWGPILIGVAVGRVISVTGHLSFTGCVTELVLVHLRDERKLVGNLRSIDQYELCVKLQISATETFEMLNKAFPNDAPKRTTVFEWHSRFKAGRISIEDDPRQRPQNFKGMMKMCKKSPI
ncbi:ANAPC7 [Cordylochernes scorpioides]|uniref:ANAPC7 n=1 Tax=Cordylochernes scorpioides TaxID=51811 RepID=A0ABY6LJJ7_9ARAC|nr:ANAPC7 [Cordylochernes scorpioides]